MLVGVELNNSNFFILETWVDDNIIFWHKKNSFKKVEREIERNSYEFNLGLDDFRIL